MVTLVAINSHRASLATGLVCNMCVWGNPQRLSNVSLPPGREGGREGERERESVLSDKDRPLEWPAAVSSGCYDVARAYLYMYMWVPMVKSDAVSH